MPGLRHAGPTLNVLVANGRACESRFRLLPGERDPIPALTASVGQALRLGCAAVGYTIYPGSARSPEMYQQLREVVEEAKRAGLAVVVWSYPPGSRLSKEGETAIDVVQSVFDGRRIVIFSGGPREEDDAVFTEARAIRGGGRFGSIIGRNSFQRPKPVDEVEASWRAFTPLPEHRPPVQAYPAGTWGPEASDALPARDGRRWLQV